MSIIIYISSLKKYNGAKIHNILAVLTPYQWQMRPRRDANKKKSWFSRVFKELVTRRVTVEYCEKSILNDMHLSPPSYNLSARNYSIVRKIYDQLRIDKGIDDVMFETFLRRVLDMKKLNLSADSIFSLFDTDMGNSVDFDEFYLCICILIANHDNKMADFFAANSRTCFDLLDTESLGMITKYQGKHLTFLLKMDEMKISKAFDEFDTSHDQALDYEEFRRFTQRCIDQNRTDTNDSEWQGCEYDSDSNKCKCKCDCSCISKCWTCCRDGIVNWLTDPVTY